MYTLIQMNGPEAGRMFPLNAYQTVGRGVNNQLVVSDPTVSREQCAIQVQNDQITLVAPPTAAPMLVNGQRVGNCALREGDVLQMGQTQFQVRRAAQTVPMGAVGMGMPTMTAGAPMGHSPHYAQMPPNPMPPPYPPAGGYHQQITVVLRQKNTTLAWAIFAFIFICPLLCIAAVALFLLPYTMMAVGAALLIWGWIEVGNAKRMFTPVPTVDQMKVVVGGILFLLGLLWVLGS